MFSSISVRLLLVTAAVSLSACGVGPSRVVQVAYENNCQSDGSSQGLAACDRQAKLLHIATVRGARGFNLYCEAPNGTVREIDYCTEQFRLLFIAGGVDLNYPVYGPTARASTGPGY